MNPPYTIHLHKKPHLSYKIHPVAINCSSLFSMLIRNGRQRPPVSYWSEWRDSNSRHPGPKPGALPTGPHPEMSIIVLPVVVPYCRFAALSGCKQKHAPATPTKQLGHTRKYTPYFSPTCAISQGGKAAPCKENRGYAIISPKR